MSSSFPINCLQCEVRQLGGFCSLGDEALRKLNTIGTKIRARAGDRVLMEGYPSNRLLILCAGQVKITLSNRQGRVLILRIATRGDVLGMAASLRNAAYDSTAVAIEECELKAISREEFLRFMKEFSEVARNSARVVAGSYSAALLSARRLALSGSAAGKLASVLLDWEHRVSRGQLQVKFAMPLTHEELGSMAGISRETATRVMGDFRQNGWITQDGPMLSIRNESALAALFS